MQLPAWNRAVLKVGSNLIAPEGRGLSTRHLLGIARAVAELRAAGREIVVVSSGAVAAGRALLRAGADGRSIVARQALAALGQPKVLELWSKLLDVPCAQVLLAYDDLQNRRRFNNARNTLRELLAQGVLPVVNENDSVAVDELRVGDNDNLAAHVAVLVEADLLVVLSDVAGLYDADPRTIRRRACSNRSSASTRACSPWPAARAARSAPAACGPSSRRRRRPPRAAFPPRSSMAATMRRFPRWRAASCAAPGSAPSAPRSRPRTTGCATPCPPMAAWWSTPAPRVRCVSAVPRCCRPA